MTLQEKLAELIAGASALIPEAILAGLFLLLLLMGMMKVRSWHIYLLTIIGLAATAVAIYFSSYYYSPNKLLLLGSWNPDSLSVYFKYLFLFSSAVFVLMVGKSRKGEFLSAGKPELLAFMVSATLGLFIMVSSGSLPIIYLGMELLSISSYLMVSFGRGARSAEAGLKYLLYGAICSATMVYGMSWYYGVTGQLQLFSPEVVAQFADVVPIGLYLALGLMAVGFLFKVTVFPFHGWAPDIYAGAPTAVVSFLSVASKAGGMVLLARLVLSWWSAEVYFQEILTILIFLSLTVGNFAALWQNDMKRMLAYSGIAQSGFILLPLLSGSGEGIYAMAYYLTIFLLMNSAAFLIVLQLETVSGSTDLSAQDGLGKKLPTLGIATIVVMVSLTGLPPTAGFMAKFLVFTELWTNYESSGSLLLLALFIFGLLNAAISLFYYLRLPFRMFFREGDAHLSEGSRTLYLAISFLAVLLLALFLVGVNFPLPTLDL